MPAWECYACTWLNQEINVDCLMCQTKRARILSHNAGKTEEISVCGEAHAMLEEKMSLRQHNDNDDDKWQKPATEVKQQNINSKSTSIQHSASNNRQEIKLKHHNESNSIWDAFASLENNYESSDSDEDESDSEDDGSENCGDVTEYNQQDDDGKVAAEQFHWNAFESLEANLGDDSSTSNSSSGEESDCILIDDQDEGEKMVPASAAMSTKSNQKTECVDLVDTDDEEDVRQEKNSKPKRIDSRKRKRVSDPSAISLMDGDSDSSYLSEVESSRPLQISPATRQGTRSLPPWQRAARSKSKSPSILQNDRVLPRESFSLLSSRNDVNGSGLNETRASAPPARQPKQRKTSTKTSTFTKTGSRRKRSNSDGAVTAKKKRRPRKYRRSSKRGSRGGRGGAAAASSSSRNNNPWSARERGIRQQIRDNNGSGSGSYMNITKQEPMLRNIGGASIQF